ncbi:hypothetical protein Y032_0008g33 [Ancylostoma ceylanicum]|uniref:Uncharacterized protein n=1 Tax=Ancylostoma ceylanicum TaxID=53326 RepID=A0A016VMX2_9BILA|nr:hypothetical protein Y032_0008g33 [Ancylostoma ceylanicum]
MEMDVAGKSPTGAPKKRWKDAVRNDMEEVGVTKDGTRTVLSGIGEPTQRTLRLCGTNAKEKKILNRSFLQNESSRPLAEKFEILGQRISQLLGFSTFL